MSVVKVNNAEGMSSAEAAAACEALLDALDERNARVASDTNGDAQEFDTSGPVMAAALLDANWTLAEVERLLPDLALWRSDREREHLEAAAAKISRPWDLLAGMAGQAASEARSALCAAAPTPAADDDGWTFADLTVSAAMTPTYSPGALADRVVYASGLTTFVGHGDSGKSTIGQAVALDAMRAGRFVVHLDWEQGQQDVIRKYVQLGAGMDELRGLLGIPQSPGAITLDRLRRLVPPGQPIFVLVDSFAKAAAAAGLSGTDWAGHGTLASDLNTFSVEHDCPVLLIDHLAKSGTGTTTHASGSHEKFDAAYAQWNVKVEQRFDEATAGEVVLSNAKARRGGLDDQVRYALGGDGHERIRVRRVGKGEASAIKVDRDILTFLREATEPQPKSAIENKVSGNDHKVREGLDRLVAGGQVRAVKSGRWMRFELSAG